MSKSRLSSAWKAGYPPTGTSAQRQHPPLFDALTATASSLQQLLRDGKIKSTDLVEEYVWRIEEYNPYLKAVSQYAPGVMEQARIADERRAAGISTGPLQGIPVLLKNSISTAPSFEMDTTAGALALLGSVPKHNAVVVEKLLQAGAIILGKTSVSELSFHKGFPLVCGWSAIDGQGQSAYVRGGCDPDDTFGGHSVPGGSSSGLSIAISAGLSPGGVGCDTESSVTAPSTRASLYSIRPSTGIISAQGIVPVSHSFDVPGPMAKSVRDVADLLTILVDPHKTTVPAHGYGAALNNQWSDFRVGSLDPRTWKFPDFVIKPVPEATEQMALATEEAYARIKGLAGAYHEHIELRSVSDFQMGETHSIYELQDVEFLNDINEYLSQLEASTVHSLQELVDWNSEHAEQALPDGTNQSSLLASLKSNQSPEWAEKLRKHFMEVGAHLDVMFNKYDINIIIAPSDCAVTQFASAKGYPVATLPLGYLDFNGRPFGLLAMAAAHQEPLLLSFMSAYEATFPARKPPVAFQSHGKTQSNI